jgi:hypothetical protein
METLPQTGRDERPALAGEHKLRLFEAVHQHNQHSKRFVLNHRLMNRVRPARCEFRSIVITDSGGS